MRATALPTSVVAGGKFRKIWVKPCSVICGAEAILIRKGILAASAACATEIVLPEIVGADEKRATVTDQALSDDAAIFRFGFGIAVDELDWRTTGFLREYPAEFVSLSRLLSHEGLDAAEVENNADLDWGALRNRDARQNAGAECASPGGKDLPPTDPYVFAHVDPLPV